MSTSWSLLVKSKILKLQTLLLTILDPSISFSQHISFYQKAILRFHRHYFNLKFFIIHWFDTTDVIIFYRVAKLYNFEQKSSFSTCLDLVQLPSPIALPNPFCRSISCRLIVLRGGIMPFQTCYSFYYVSDFTSLSNPFIFLRSD